MSDDGRYTVTINQATVLTGISRRRIEELLLAGRLKGRKNGAKNLIYVDSLKEYVDSLPPT